jgi:hypothetical protein
VHFKDCVIFSNKNIYTKILSNKRSYRIPLRKLLSVLAHQFTLHWVLMRFKLTHSQKCGRAGHQTQFVVIIGNVSDLFLACAWFESRPDDRLS